MPSKEFIVYIPQEKGTCPHHMGPQGGAAGLIRKQSKEEAWPRAFMVFLCSALGKARQGRGSGLGLASLNNCLGLRAQGLFLVVWYRTCGLVCHLSIDLGPGKY